MLIGRQDQQDLRKHCQFNRRQEQYFSLGQRNGDLKDDSEPVLRAHPLRNASHNIQ